MWKSPAIQRRLVNILQQRQKTNTKRNLTLYDLCKMACGRFAVAQKLCKTCSDKQNGGVQLSLAICHLYGPPKRAQVTCSKTYFSYCVVCARDICPADIDTCHSDEHSPYVRRCFSCFRRDPLAAEYYCELTHSCKHTIWLCMECRTLRTPTPCPNCWSEILKRPCFGCDPVLPSSQR